MCIYIFSIDPRLVPWAAQKLIEISPPCLRQVKNKNLKSRCTLQFTLIEWLYIFVGWFYSADFWIFWLDKGTSGNFDDDDDDDADAIDADAIDASAK